MLDYLIANIIGIPISKLDDIKTVIEESAGLPRLAELPLSHEGRVARQLRSPPRVVEVIKKIEPLPRQSKTLRRKCVLSVSKTGKDKNAAPRIKSVSNVSQDALEKHE